ncbi:tumor protein D53 homolog isoform X8 [Oncorhynchus kisutch]|uniref:tumor protein D53 homolog isoform X8 n=1 Tax=Oncorhynchus kisutch TaxID=8019 RepID=UPI0012DC81C3|nr:tumor protein D53 homolog isoform X8 [Oncorhynchus kisutch]
METRQQGLLDPEPVTEVDEEMVSDVDLNNTLTDEEREEILSELTKLEEDISTLRQVLASKEKHHSELKAKLGITPLIEFKQNFNRSWYDMQTSTAYKKTSETLSTAGQKTSAAFTTLGTAISRKFGDMRPRWEAKGVEGVLRRCCLQPLTPVPKKPPATTCPRAVIMRGPARPV